MLCYVVNETEPDFSDPGKESCIHLHFLFVNADIAIVGTMLVIACVFPHMT